MRQLVRSSRKPYIAYPLYPIYTIYTIVDNDLSPMHFRLATWIGDPPAGPARPRPRAPRCEDGRGAVGREARDAGWESQSR